MPGRLSIQHRRCGVDHRGDAHRGQHLLDGDARLAHGILVRLEALAAAVNGRDRQAPQFEIRACDAGGALQQDDRENHDEED